MSNGIKTGNRHRSAFVDRPIVKALTGKLVHETSRGRYVNRNRQGDVVPSLSSLHSISRRISDASRDADNMRAVMPDIELAEEILISTIISPNDFKEVVVTYKAEDLPEIPPQLVNKFITIVSDFFENELPLKALLPEAIRQALLRKGSYPLLVIPESSLDDIINGRTSSMEAYKNSLSRVSLEMFTDDRNSMRPLGILGDSGKATGKGRWSFENLDGSGRLSKFTPASDTVHVTDNYQILKMPMLAEKHRQQQLSSKLFGGRASMEALSSAKHTGLDGKEAKDINAMMASLYKRNSHIQTDVVRIKTVDKATRMPIGHPLSMHFPPEALIVVHSPGNPKDHLGYYGMIDMEGYPVSINTSSNYYTDMINRSSFNSDQVSNVIGKANVGTNGTGGVNEMTLAELRSAYINYTELNFLERLNNGIYGKHVEMTRPELVYNIMLARSLASMQTTMLWIPAELMTYVAFDYDEFGIGQSVLTKNRVIGMVRAALLFSNSIGAMKNSTNHREVTFTIDEDDETPEESYEAMMTDYLKVNAINAPFTSAHPLDINDQMVMANTSFKVEGGNERLPNVNVSIDDKPGQRVLADSDHTDKVDSMFFMGMGVTKSIMDATADVEFAVAAVNENILLSKRSKLRQEVLLTHMTKFARTYVANSGKLLSDLILAVREYVASNKDDGVQYERGASSRLRDSKPELTVNSEVKDKLADPLDKPEMSLDEEPATDAVPAEGEVPATPETETPEGEDVTVQPYDVVSTNETYDLDGMDEMGIVDLFLTKLEIGLPEANNTKLEDQMALLEAEETAADKIIEIFLSDAILAEILGPDAETAKDAIRESYKLMYLKQVISENNIMPNLIRLLDPTEDEAETNINNLEEHAKYVAGISETVKNLFKSIKARFAEGDELDSGGSSMPTSDPEGGSSGGGEFGGDFDMPDISGGAEAGADEEPEEKPEEPKEEAKPAEAEPDEPELE